MPSLTDAYDRRVGDGGGRRGRDEGRNAGGRNSTKRSGQNEGDRSKGDGERTGRRRAAATTTTQRRPYLGVGLLAVSSVLVAGGVVLATSVTVASAVGLAAIEATEIARMLAGIGLPLTFVGALALVPASRRSSALATIGFVLAVAGVAAFSWAYPGRWLGDPLDLTVPVVALYAVGSVLAFLALLAGVPAVDRGTESEDAPETERRERGGRTSL
jgi:hypothetical protein